MVTKQTELEGNAALLGVAERCRVRAVGHRDDGIGLDLVLTCELPAERAAGPVDSR